MISKMRTAAVVLEILGERRRQHEKWGEQNLPDGCNGPIFRLVAERHQISNDAMANIGSLTWAGVLREEVYEALAEDTDSAALRAELLQVAAVACAWIEAIDRRNQRMGTPSVKEEESKE